MFCFFLIIWINWFKRLWFRRDFVFLFSHFLFEIRNIFDLRKTLGWPKPSYFNYFCTWLNCNAFKTETIKHDKYVRSLKCYNGLICARGHFMFEFFNFFFFIFVLAQRSFGKYKSSIHKKSQLSISHPGCSGLVFYS